MRPNDYNDFKERAREREEQERREKRAERDRKEREREREREDDRGRDRDDRSDRKYKKYLINTYKALYCKFETKFFKNVTFTVKISERVISLLYRF